MQLRQETRPAAAYRRSPDAWRTIFSGFCGLLENSQETRSLGERRQSLHLGDDGDCRFVGLGFHRPVLMQRLT